MTHRIRAVLTISVVTGMIMTLPRRLLLNPRFCVPTRQQALSSADPSRH